MKLNVFGNQPILANRDPELPMEVATKNYVDTIISGHATNEDLHLTPAEKLLLTTLSSGSSSLVQLEGLTGNVQDQLDKRLLKTGDTMTGPLVLSGAPTLDLHSVTKYYVDTAVDKKLNLSGGTMTGHLVLTGAPTVNLHPATKLYVDTGLTTHSSDKTVHLTSEQNNFLDNLSATHTEVNRLSGVHSSVQTQLDARLPLTGGILTGDLTLAEGKAVFVSKVPNAQTELVNKEYVDSRIKGLEWKDPVTEVNLVSTRLSTPPVSPTLYDVYIVSTGATGHWTGREGYAVQYSDTGWVYLQDRPVAIGDRFGVRLTSATVVGGELTSNVGKIVTITDATVGSLQFEIDANTPGSTTLVYDTDSKHFGISFTLTDENNWVATNTSVNISPGDGMRLDGNVLNLNLGNGVVISDNNLSVKVDTSTGLKLNTEGVSILTADSTIDKSPLGISVSATTVSAINDRVSKTTGGDVTGLITVKSTGGLKIESTVVSPEDATNKAYVDGLNTLLAGRVSTIEDNFTGSLDDLVSKDYVNNRVNLAVMKVGDTMTGPLVLSGAPVSSLHAATKQYTDSSINSHATNATVHVTSTQSTLLSGITVTSAEINRLSGVAGNVQTQLSAKLDSTGGTLTGYVEVHAAPVSNLQLANKKYVDDLTKVKVSKAGDTMTGPLVLPGAPVSDLQASTKGYVDGKITTLTNYTDNQLDTKVSKTGGTLTGSLILKGAPELNLEAATKLYVDTSVVDAVATINTSSNLLTGRVSSLEGSVNGLLADPVTKEYVNQNDALRLNKAGDTMTGYLVLHANPTQNLHPTTKQYVDAIAQGLTTKPAIRLGTTGPLAVVYNNGTSGINSSLTGTSNGLLSLDGKTVTLGDRILVMHQVNKAHNGVYSVQQIGSGSTPFILKRVETADQSGEIPGSYFYIYDGATLKGTGWVFTVDNPITFSIGTGDINVNQFSGQGSIIPGDGLSLDGNTLKIGTVSATRIIINSSTIDLATTGVTPNTYRQVVVDGYGRVTGGSNPNTLQDYGITDAQPLNANVTSLSGLATTGVIVRNQVGTIVTKEVTSNGVGISVTNSTGANSGNIIVNSNATSASNAGTLVSRDVSGNFAANQITATLLGNSSTATKLTTARNFSLTGDVGSATVSFDGGGNVNLVTQLATTGVAAGTYTKVTVNTKGLVTSATSPTTLVGHGITDAATIVRLEQEVLDLRKEMNDLYLYIMARI